MATRNTDASHDKIPVIIPRSGGKEDPNFFVGVNGKNYLIPKGQAVEVPPEVASEIARHTRAVNAMFDARDSLKRAQ